MMSYIRLNGAGAAFGWRKDVRVTVGGLKPRTEYALVCQHDSFPAVTDAQGARTGQVLHDVPLCLALNNQPVFWDESQVSMAQAAALLAARNAPAPFAPALSAPELPKTEPAKIPISAPEIHHAVEYRQPSDGAPCDDLPILTWPEAAAKLRPYFASNPPIRLLEDLPWRTVRRAVGQFVD